MKPIPQIQKYMSTSPHTVGSEQMLVKAKELMKRYNIRHLPVLHAGKVVGMVSDRDIALVQSLSSVSLETTAVADAMADDPYVVDPGVALDQVITTMAEKKYGSAVVVQNGHVVGIFTVIDALVAFAELLHTRLGK